MENNSGNFVTVEDFNKYTEYVKNTLDGVKESANSNSDELIQKLVTYTEHIAEKVNQVTDYTEYLSENLDKSISYSDYLAENVDKIKNYSSYLGEELDKTIQYSEHVAEQADKGIQYSNYLGEAVEKGIEYSEYVAEKVDQNIAYSEYLGEGLSKSIKYSEYIAENANTVEATSINESKEEVSEYSGPMKEGEVCEKCGEIHEGACGTNENKKSYKDTISEKLAALISKAETKNLTEMHFMNFLSESKKNEFDSLADDKKVLLVESMNSNQIMSTVQAENVWESCFITERKVINFIDDMPSKYSDKWSNLSENRKQQIIAESKFHSLGTPYAINNFWQTRDMRNTQMSLESINESKSAGEAAQIKSEPLLNESFQADLINKMKFRLGR